ncbi:hypothetical protein PAXRUDRAFT_168813 [Paxillus rubicundulus Ve08.2h10]|uniref:Reverse transcriptase zinc-binding domain-containing protein n=1 Tax=Paxillus rubicundulus Ve08.2h10 TaxID=930991 RepID=A0A0D0CZM9_9AGAM|nr:hypothetical protein PAXRUDRAFT_168813 [Paxillus rubicundulus Ve08.2h10]
MLSGSYIKLVAMLPCRHANLLIWLRTKHIALNEHLHCIAKANTPYCPHCPGIREDVPHFMLKCPQYAREQQILTRHLRRRASYLPFLLSNSKAIPFLMNYINSTGCLKPTFGDVSLTQPTTS